jgi:hypothetical protein
MRVHDRGLPISPSPRAAARGLGTLLAAASLLGGCRLPAEPPPGSAAAHRDAAAVARKPGAFADVTEQAGIRFTLDNGERGRFFLISTTPAGCAFLDYDRDGLLDVFLVQAGAAPGDTAPEGGRRPSCRLYRNEGGGRFRDVSAAAGIEGVAQDFGHGVAVGDYDNDGWPDLYLTSYNGNHLLRNTGTGRFTDVTRQAGVADDAPANRWATSAAWGDYDRDGRLDLIVLHYVPWTPATDKECKNSRGKRSYCSPELYDPDIPRLYRNLGGGKFADVTRQTGLDGARGRGLAVTWGDFDQDGWPDLYIACDLTPNLLLRSRKGQRFEEVGLAAGAAYGPDAQTLSGMGIAAGDFDDSGRESLFVTNFSAQPNTVYRNLSTPGAPRFEDATYQSGMGEASLNFLAWGIESLDYDNDGRRDIIAGCGHIDPLIEETVPNTTYKQRKQLFKNVGQGMFRDETGDLGDLAEPRVTRGLAVGDFDNDGKMDVLDNAHNQPARLYRNVLTDSGHFLNLRLEGVRSNRDAAGAQVWVTTPGGRRQLAEVRCGSSYASTSDRRLHFGLGKADHAAKIEVRWPSGARQTFLNVAADRFYHLREGAIPVPDPKVK